MADAVKADLTLPLVRIGEPCPDGPHRYTSSLHQTACEIRQEIQMDDLVALLTEAKEFVADISQRKMSEEPSIALSMYIRPAEKLRREAEKIEQRDAMIERARQLLPKIEEALLGRDDDEECADGK